MMHDDEYKPVNPSVVDYLKMIRDDKHKPVNPLVVDYLVQAEAPFELLKLDSQEAIKAYEWLVNNFPIASWGRIAWDKVPKSSCMTWTDFSELLPAFEKLVMENKLEGSVIVSWSNPLRLPLKITMDILVKYAEPIFEEDWDTWVCNEENEWCIEVYHEGEICFGHTCGGAI